MIFQLEHTMTYVYDRPVFLEPMTLRLQPRPDCTQEVLQYDCRLTPTPAGSSENVDLDGNATRTVWFDSLQSSLEIVTCSKVRTLRQNPFGFLLADPSASRLPIVYPAEFGMALSPYRQRATASAEVDTWTKKLLDESGAETLLFLANLTRQIAGMCRQIIRETGDPLAPEQMLVAEEAACRDLAVLGMDACRAVGLAARFVSGYEQPDDEQALQHLHSWFEVYLPGAGWRGYDPTNGIAVADRHVALCAAAEPNLAAPTTGTYRGTGAGSQLSYELRITTDMPAAAPAAK